MFGGNLVNHSGRVNILESAYMQALTISTPAHLSPHQYGKLTRRYHKFKGLGRRRVWTICGAGAATGGAGGARILLFFGLDPKSALKSINKSVRKKKIDTGLQYSETH
jgi:hypothetical protein